MTGLLAYDAGMETIELNRRVELLDSAVTRATLQGGRVVSRGQYEAVIETGRKKWHVLHAILTLFTLGGWLVVWLIASLMDPLRRRVVTVDEYGRTWMTNRLGVYEPF